MVYTYGLLKALNNYYNTAKKDEVIQSVVSEIVSAVADDEETRCIEHIANGCSYEKWVEKIYPYVVNFGFLIDFISAEWHDVKNWIDYIIAHKTFPYDKIADDDEKKALFESLFCYSVNYFEDEKGLTKYVSIHKFREID